MLIIPNASAPPRFSPRRLLRLIRLAVGLAWRAGRREVLLTIGLQLLDGAALVTAILLGRRLVADVLRGGGAVTGSALLVAAAGGVMAFAGAAMREQQQLLGELCQQRGQSLVLDVATRADLAAFDDPAFHDRIERAQRGLFRATQVVFSLFGIGNALAGLAATLAALLALRPLLVPFALAALVPVALATSRRGEAYYRFAFAQTARDRERHYLAHVLSAREAAAEVRAFELAGFLRARHDRLAEERVRGLRRVVRRQLAWALAANVVAAAVVAVTIVGVTSLHGLGVAGAAAAVGAIALFGQRAAGMATSTGSLYESALFLEDFFAFAATPPPPAAAVARPDTVRVEARDVAFTYPSGARPALRGVTMHIEPGVVVALVGENGSGKTTLAKLLAGLYEPAAGEVRWNGAAATAVAFQDYTRWMLTARDNIALGRHERFADEAGVRAAARRSGAAADIAALPDGYATILGPAFIGGTDLSGGQWQRVALARLFFRDAPFVILDEPTAALDAKAEHALFASIRELLSGRSVLLISHRFSSVREADRIYVVHEGEVVEAGGHDELLAAGGRYAEMFSLQAAAYR